MHKKSSAIEGAAPSREHHATESPEDGANGRARRLGKRRDIKSLALIKDSTIKIYQEMYKEIFHAGALDRKTKELIAIAASTITGCEGCLNGHLRKARALGATPTEIKEAVAVAFAVNAATVVDRSDVAAAEVQFDESARTKGAKGSE